MSRKLDAAIAELLGYDVLKGDRPGLGNYWLFGDMPIPCYSTDGNAMLELDREMRERGYLLRQSKNMIFGWEASYGEAGSYELFKAIGEVEPLTRALAAYKALTGKEWQDGK